MKTLNAIPDKTTTASNLCKLSLQVFQIGQVTPNKYVNRIQ